MHTYPSRDILENPVDPQIVKKSPALYIPQMFITVFTRAPQV